MTRIALVTGGNRGIGFCIVQQLCKQFDGTVILTARNESQGLAACTKLQEDGDTNVETHQLDITSQESIKRLRCYVEEKFGGLDILINNAGILIPSYSGMSYASKAKLCVQTNFFGTIDVCRIMSPLLREKARVVNVSSSMGSLNIMDTLLQRKFASPKLTRKGCIELMQQYVSDVNDGRARENGWPSGVHNPAYCMSKLGLTVMTSIMAREIKDDSTRKEILLNAVCPGWCRTDLGGSHAPRSPEIGARASVYAALLPPDATSPNGQLMSDEKVIPWKQCNS